MAGGYCTIDGCKNEEEAGGLCAGHRKRKTQGQTVAGELKETDLSGFERVLEAIKEMDQPRYDGDEGEHAWRQRLRAAAWAWLDPAGELRRIARSLRKGNVLEVRQLARRRGRRKPLPRWDEG